MSSEQAFRFGRARHLVGLVGLPASPTPTDSVGVIVLNAGLVHRIGPFRLHVEMTRRLNARGYPTLRLDLSSLGDSGASTESQSQAQQVRADLVDAMDLLQARAGCTRFVLIGLCSGAQNAHTVAATEQRVAGVIFLDGYAYRTLGFRLRHYLPKILSPARWYRYVRRRLHRGDGPGEPVYGVKFPPRDQVLGELSGMLDRGLRLGFIFSGGAGGYFNHLGQFRECYGRVARRPGISVELLGETDHTFVLETDRRHLLERIEGWLAHNFPAPAVEVSP